MPRLFSRLLPRLAGAASALALLAVLVVLPAGAQDERAPLVELEVRGSPYVFGGGEPIDIGVTLREAADLRVRVTDYDGRLVREIFDGRRKAGTLERSWYARDRDLERVPVGPYRIVASASTEEARERAVAWVTVAERAVYPRRPGLITVALDPGHGGSYDGAVGGDGTREADLNLDIGLRLARMLEAAGVHVVITRTTDAHVNDPPQDLSGDGVIDSTDELAARPDAANRARADLFISIHNNTAVNGSVGGPSTFYFDERPFSARSLRLARYVQDSMIKALRGAGPGSWEPYDHGVLIYPYYVLRGYDPPRLNRPTQMPAVLSEGMFLSNERELRLLKPPAVRAAMAAAYYEAIARYLDRRETHAGYDLVAGPTQPVTGGETATYEVEVRNTGNEEMRGWRLGARITKADEPYIGRIGRGTEAGFARIRRLGPGKRAVVRIDVTAPDTQGEHMVLFDAEDRDGRRASRSGSPMLQVPLTTVRPPEPSPSPEPSASPAPSSPPEGDA